MFRTVGIALSESAQLWLVQCWADKKHAHSSIGRGKLDRVKMIKVVGLLDSGVRGWYTSSGYHPSGRTELFMFDEHSIVSRSDAEDFLQLA